MTTLSSAPLRPYLLPLALLAACGSDPGFRGTFQGNAVGSAVSVQLEPKGSDVSGQASVAGVSYTVKGKIDGDRLTGSATQPMMMGLEVKVEGRLEGDTLHWTAHLPDPFGGATHPLTVQLTRAGATTARAQANAPAGNLDPRLVGNWRRTVSQSLKQGPGENFNMATDIYCTLGADGSYQFGGAQSAFSSEGKLGSAGGGAGPAAVTTGKWKTENQILYATQGSGSEWAALGRYSVSGDGLVIYPPGGGQQDRER